MIGLTKYSSSHTVYLNRYGEEVPSVTTVLKILNKPFLTKWANIMGFKRRSVDDILKNSARIGTYVHDAIRSNLMGYYHVWMGDYIDMIQVLDRMDGFKIWKAKHTIEPFFMEHSLISDMVGGTCDFYGLFDSKRTVLDFKTSKKVYSSMFLQLASYVQMLEAEGIVVEQVGIVTVGETKTTVTIITREELTPYIESFNILLELFHKWFDLNEAKGWGSIV